MEFRFTTEDLIQLQELELRLDLQALSLECGLIRRFVICTRPEICVHNQCNSGELFAGTSREA